MLFLLTLASFAAVQVPASGTARERIIFQKGPAYQKDFPALPPNDIIFGATITPNFCNTAPGCDTHPLTVVPPDLGNSADYYVHLTLSWDASAACNLQLYIWDDAGTRLVQASATANQPERVIMYAPEGRFNIVVHHPGAEPNFGYRLRIEMTFEILEGFSELLEEAPPPTTKAGSFVPPADTPATGAVPTFPSFALSPLNPDSDFAFTQDVSGGGGLVAPAFATRPKPGPVNGLAFAVFVFVVPMLALAAGFVWLRKRAHKFMEYA